MVGLSGGEGRGWEWWTWDRNHVTYSRVGVEGVGRSMLLLSAGVTTLEGKLENSFCGDPISKSDADSCSKLIKFSGRSRQPHNAAYYSSRCIFQISVYAQPLPPPIFFETVISESLHWGHWKGLGRGAHKWWGRVHSRPYHSINILRISFQPPTVNENQPKALVYKKVNHCHFDHEEWTCDLLTNGGSSFVFQNSRHHNLEQCFSTAGPRPGTGPWQQL